MCQGWLLTTYYIMMQQSTGHVPGLVANHILHNDAAVHRDVPGLVANHIFHNDAAVHWACARAGC